VSPRALQTALVLFMPWVSAERYLMHVGTEFESCPRIVYPH